MVEQAETKAGWIVLIVAGGVYAAIGWIFFIGLKVLKPQEALVLTLFGKYVGTIKEAGFYFVNPFVWLLTQQRQLSLIRAVM